MIEATARHAGECVLVEQSDDHGQTARLIVTIDGPAGTGKSSVARDLASRLGLDFLDTGAMYRAATALALDQGISLSNGTAIASLVREGDLHFEWSADPPTLIAFGESIMHRLRDADVTANVSQVSSLPELRTVLVERQRRIGEAHPRLVSEGRDQGSVVFHDGNIKFFLEASARERARRRADQLRASGVSADENSIERDLIERDRRDSEREVGPLICAPDALRVDTSHMTRDQVVNELERLVHERVGDSD